MRLLPAALGVLLLLALLTWLLLRGIDTNAPAYAMTLHGALPAAAGNITNVTQFPSVEILL